MTPRSDQDAAGEQMRTMLASGAARHRHGCHGGRVGSSQESGKHDPTVFFRDSLQNVAAIRDGAYRNHHQPGLEGVQVEAAELLIGQRRQNDRREQQKLGEGEDLKWSGAAGDEFETHLQFQQQEAGHAQGHSDPEVVVINESPHQIGREARHFRGDSGGVVLRKLVRVRQQQKTAHDEKAQGYRQELSARE